MAFESLSERYEFVLQDLPAEWLPLTHLYDPDLPLFPVSYFHVIDPELPAGRRPGARDRAFGFIHHINLEDDGVHVTIATNKNFSSGRLPNLAKRVEEEVRHRLGLGDPVTVEDLRDALSGALASGNDLIRELWYQAADSAFGKKLPFGRMWDPVHGLARAIASWFSEGRKGELIQTHYFLQRFGVRVPTGAAFHADFYLLPTYEEFRDTSNPLALYPRFAALMNAAKLFVETTCKQRAVEGMSFSAFQRKQAGVKKLDTAGLMTLFKRFGKQHETALMDHYSAFNRGPPRSVLGLMMFDDLRQGRWDPAGMTVGEAAGTYADLPDSYQSPKVIHLYTQLCFGNRQVLPIDNWVKTFLRWPLALQPLNKRHYRALFESCAIWGKVERLIWMAVQARKVHSSTCESILWCIRYGDSENHMRGANPLACKICAESIRKSCPAYAGISASRVSFNKRAAADVFRITTSAGDNSTRGQDILSCEYPGAGTFDTYSVRDRPKEFAPYPQADHAGAPLSVADFIDKY